MARTRAGDMRRRSPAWPDGFASLVCRLQLRACAAGALYLTGRNQGALGAFLTIWAATACDWRTPSVVPDRNRPLARFETRVPASPVGDEAMYRRLREQFKQSQHTNFGAHAGRRGPPSGEIMLLLLEGEGAGEDSAAQRSTLHSTTPRAESAVLAVLGPGRAC